MVLLRAELGEVLRDLRMEQGRTLREISRASSVSSATSARLSAAPKKLPRSC